MTLLNIEKRKRRTDVPVAPLARPGARGKALTNEVREQDRKWKPTYAVWEITLACDLACNHCGSRAGKARPDELSTQEALDFVQQLKDAGTKEVTIIGGEAYLREDWDVIARAITDAGMSCTMTTGGRGLDKERARRAKAAGIRSVSISVDGLEATHDMLRGVKGSWAAAMQAMENLKEVGIPFSSNTQICRPTMRQLPELFEVLTDKGFHSWQIQITVAMGRAADDDALLLQPWHLLEVFPMLAGVARRAKEKKVRIWPGNNLGYFGPYEGLLKGELPLGHMWSCGAGRSTLGVEANGAVKGCPSLPSSDYTGGNLRDHSLVDIWQKADELRFTRDRTVDNGLWGHCRTCYYADHCRSGCSWTSHVLFGRPGNNPYCHHRALELLREGRRERVVKVEEAEGQPFDAGKFELVEEDFPQAVLEEARRIVEDEGGQFSDLDA